MLILCFWSAAWSQDRLVSGKVTSADEQMALPGVNVLVEGTTKGTTTDSEGNYSIQLASGENSLVFSFVGYTPFTVQVGNQTTIDVVLQTDVQSLSEIVVVGYGVQREKDLTSSISTLKTSELTKTPSGQAMQALQGKVPGVQIVSSGAPGDSPTIRIRGIGSYPGSGTTNQDPLYVVDGMFFDNIDFLNPSDIASISVLKDASAAAIYGVRAANGVVLIETKSGKIGQKAQITYDGYYGVQIAQNVLKMANAEQFATMANESGSVADAGFVLNAMQRYGRSRVNPNVPNVNTDWYDEILRRGPIQNHNLSVNGGGERTAYSIGANFFSQDGIMDHTKNSYERFNIRTKLDYNATDWFTIGGNFNLSNATKYSPDASVWNLAYFAVPILPIRDDLNTDAIPVSWADATDLGYRSGQNPFPTLTYNDNQLKIRKLLANFYIKLDLIPDRLTFQTTYNNGSTFLAERNVDLPYKMSDNFQVPVSSITRKNENYINHIWDNVLTYTQSFGDHHLVAMAGTSYRPEFFEMLTARGTGFPITSKEAWYLDQAQNIITEDVRDDGRRQYGMSYFGRLSYNYKDKYLLYGTMRADGTSKYQEKWGYFPAIGAGWVVSEEDFMADANTISFLKLRASWGRLGNDKIQAQDGANTTAPITTAIDNVLTTGTKTTSQFSSLRWELTEELNFGVTSKFLEDRLSIDADYFIRDTKSAAISVNIPFTGGSLLRNVGEIRNSGFELAASWTDNVREGLNYNIGFNVATLKNEVTDLYGQPYLNGGQAEFRQRSYVGEPLLAFYGWEVEGVYQNEEQIQADPVAVANGLIPGDFRYRDQDNDGDIDDQDRKILGSYIPKLTYGANIGLSWMNFDFSLNIMGQRGNKILNRKRGELIWTADGNLDADLAKNRWHGEGTSNEYPSAAGLRKGWNQKMSTYFVEDGSFFRIQNIQLAYNIRGQQAFGVDLPSTRIILTAERPLTIFKYNGFNPEVANGVDSQTYPIPAVYTVGLNVSF